MKFLILFIALIVQPTIFAQNFLICYESAHFFPYKENADPNQKLSPVIKSIREAGEKSGLKVKFIRTSWSRCLKDISNNNVDAILTSLWTKERDKIATFPKDENGLPSKKHYIMKANYKVYTNLKSKIDWNGKEFLNLVSGIGAPKKYIANYKLKEMGVLKETDIKVKQAFDLIVKNRIDGYVIMKDVADIILKNYKNKDQIKFLDKDFITDLLYIPVSNKFAKDYPELTKSFFNELSIARNKYMPNGL